MTDSNSNSNSGPVRSSGLSGVPLDPTPFAKLLVDDRHLALVYRVLESAIMRSFAEDAKRSLSLYSEPTRTELLHRFKLCEAWFRRARGELGYSLDKTLDLMGLALRSALDGKPFDPESGATNLWVPT